MSCHPPENSDPRRRTIRRNRTAGRLDQPGPSARVPLLSLGDPFKYRGALLILLSSCHRAVKGDPIHLDEIVLAVPGNVGFRIRLLRFHWLGWFWLKYALT